MSSSLDFIAKILKVKTKENGKNITFEYPEESLDIQPGQYVKLFMDDDIEKKEPTHLAVALGKEGTRHFKVCMASPTNPEKQSCKSRLFKEAAVGSSIHIEGPLGRSLPMKDIAGRPLLLIAAGSGLASMRSIFARIVADEQTQILYSAKTLNNILLLKKVRQFAQHPKNYITLTREKVEDFHHGRLTEHLAGRPIADNTQVFVCGPTEFMKDTVELLLQKEQIPQNIFVILNKIIPGKEAMCPVFRLDELDEEELLTAIGLKTTNALSMLNSF